MTRAGKIAARKDDAARTNAATRNAHDLRKVASVGFLALNMPSVLRGLRTMEDRSGAPAGRESAIAGENLELRTPLDPDLDLVGGGAEAAAVAGVDAGVIAARRRERAHRRRRAE